MKAEEEKNPLPQPHDATQALKRSLEIFSGAKAVASEIEFQVKGDSLALHPAAQNILANAAHTPVFLTHLRKVHVISHKNQDYYETVTMAVSDTSDLDDYTKAAFKNSPPPRKDGYIPKDADDKTNYEKIEFKSNGLPSSNEPFTTEPIATADQLKAMKYTLVYLEGADTADFASQKNADWAMFSDDRFN
ncbi:hypothetical protein QFC24_000718 [Naganishia onofrii]|uniref:Uncharacterized protein n=1 Tax=Naganishia onofrii TaxID=1851511 RepID=A0ACC2XUI9_9TREE|nr:hypothetical protein QFC24_000718 [Naganishia onofrii]